MTTKTKSTRRTTKPTPSGKKRSRHEIWAEDNERLAKEAAEIERWGDRLVAVISAKPKSHQNEDWAGECSRLMQESAIEIRIMGELLAKMEAQRLVHV